MKQACIILLLLVAPLTITSSTAQDHPLECNVTLSGPHLVLHVHDQVNYGGCWLGATQFDGHVSHIRTPDDTKCHIEAKNETGVLVGQLHIGDPVFENWDIYGACGEVGVIHGKVEFTYSA